MATSPLAVKGIAYFFRQDVSLLTIQAYILAYTKISKALGAIVLCSNLLHVVQSIAFMDKSTYDKSQVRFAKFKYFAYEDNKPLKLSTYNIAYHLLVKLICVDVFWPYFAVTFLFGQHHIPLVMATLEIVQRQ
jgi:hypothetical protein